MQVCLRAVSNHCLVNDRELLVDDGANSRLDVYVARALDNLSRSHVQKLIEQGHVLVNGRPQRASYRVQTGDRLSVRVPPPEPTHISAEDIPLDIAYEDEHLIVVIKPRGMTVHPAPGSRHGTLVNAILALGGGLSSIGGQQRPGIVHRLDKDTSGLIVVARTDLAHSVLQRQIQSRTAERRYVALVWGDAKFNEAVVDAPVGRHPTDRQKMAVISDTSRYTARKAVTHLKALERLGGFTLLEAKLDTGRTHQIRVHCSFIGHPVVGDPVYGGTKRPLPSSYSKLDQQRLSELIDALGGQALHAQALAFEHPVTRERLSFEVPPPPDMTALLDWLRRH